MKNEVKISAAGWIGIGILAIVLIIVIFAVGKQIGQKAATENQSEILSTVAQNRLADVKLNPGEAKKLPDELKKKAEQQKDNEGKIEPVKPGDAKTADPKTAGVGVAGNWVNDLRGLFSDYGVQFMALIVSVIGVILAVSGFSLSGKKKQKFLKKYFHEIDDVYGSYKMKGKRCEAELYRLQDLIEHELKEGKIDENTFGLLEKRIEKYLAEIKEQDKVKSE